MNPVIEKKVLEVLGKNIFEKRYVYEVSELNLNGLELTDISDLVKFKNLIKLDITDTYISDLKPLAGLTRLEELYAWNNPFKSDEEKAAEKGRIKLSDMSFLMDLNNLRNIDFTNTGITDIEFVKWLPNLEIMRVYCNEIPDISPIQTLKKLKQVFFFDCGITDISVFTQLPMIEGVAINMNEVSDLSPLKDCMKITYLDAHTNKITDISVLAGMIEMRYLTLAENKITDITALTEMTEIEYLTLAKNNITDISPLAGMGKLRHLTLCSNQGLTDFSVLKRLTSLKHLGLRESNISETELDELRIELKECNISI